MTKLTDVQKLEVLNALSAFKLVKYNKMHKQVSNKLATTTGFAEKKKLEKQLAFIEEKRDEAADLLSLTID